MSSKNPFESRRITIEDLKSEKRQKELDWRDKVRYQREAIWDSGETETAHARQGVGDIAHVLEVKNDGKDQKEYNHLWPGKGGFLYKNKKEERDYKKRTRLAHDDVLKNREKIKNFTERLFHDIFLKYAGFSQKEIESISIDKKREILDKILKQMDSEISDSEFNQFIETGKISDSTVKQIASTIFSKERDLSPREKQIKNVEAFEISKIIDQMKLEESKTRKEEKDKKEKENALLSLGWLNDELSDLKEEDQNLILERGIKRSSLTPDDFSMKKLGYSLNQILFVVPDNDREKIILEKISPEDWITYSRKKVESSFKSNNISRITKKPFSQWLDSSSESTKELEINKISKIINLGWGVKEAKGMSPEKADFVLKNKIKKDDWSKWETEYREIVDSGMFVKPVSVDLELEKSFTKKESEKINELDYKKLKDLGFSDNEINEVYSEKDLSEILERGLSKEEWLKISRSRFTEKVSESKDGLVLHEEKEGDNIKSIGYDKFNFRDRRGGDINIEQKINELEDELELLRRVRSKLISPNSSGLNDIDDSYLKGETIESIDEKIKSRKDDIKYLESYFTEQESVQKEPVADQAPEETDTAKETLENKTPGLTEREITIENIPPGAKVSITKEVLSGDEAAEFVRKEGPQDGDDIDTKISKLENALKNFESLKDPKVKLVLFEFKNKLEKLKEEKKKLDVLKKEYERNEKELSSLGWDFESYSKLSEFDKSFVFWNKIQKDDYEGKKESKKEEVSVGVEKTEKSNQEVVSDEVYNNFIDNGHVPDSVIIEISQVIKNRNRELTPREFAIQSQKGKEIETILLDENINSLNQEVVQEGLTAESFAEHVLKNTKDGVLDKSAITQEQLDFYKKNKAEVKRLIEEKTGKFQTRSVSPGAQEFVKNKRVAVEKERSVQNEMSLLEKGYENLSKEELGRIAKEKGLSSSGEKQAIIDRITRFDAENGTKNFGWVKDPSIKKKLEEFNMSEKDMLFASPEFFELSPEKQRYLFSKIEQKIYLDAEFSAKDRNEQEIKQMGLFKKMAASFGKDQRKVALRDKIIGEIKSSGVADYKDDISVLGQYLKEAPDLRYIPNEKGKLAPVFEFVETTSSNKKFETPKAFFNMAASKFAEIPYEWSLDSANSTQKDAYRRARESYVSAKDALVRAMVEEAEFSNRGMNEEEVFAKKQEAMTKVLGFDAKINFGRYVTQNPEMEKITSNFTERVLGTSVNDFVRGKMFFAAGYLTRMASRSLAVTGVGLAASAAIGGYMGYRKKNLEFTEKELRKRYGSDIKDLAVKRVANSGNVYGRLEKLVTQFEKTKDENSRARILETIKTRIFVTEEMLRDGRVNFGNKKEQVFNQYKLSQLMSEASVLVAMNGGFNEQKTNEEEVFERFKDFVQDDSSESEKDRQKRNAMLRGAAVGAVGFGIGSGVRYLQDSGHLGAAWEYVSEKSSAGLEKIKDTLNSVGGATRDYLEGNNISLGEVRTGGFKPITESALTPEEILTGGEKIPFLPVAVDVGRRGAIGAIDDLQEALRERLGDTKIPEKYADFLSKDPHDLAREWGFYKPGEDAESAVILKGAKFKMSGTGVILFEDSNGKHTTLFVPENTPLDDFDGAIREDWGDSKKFEGKFFDSGKSFAAESSDYPKQSIPNQGAESNFREKEVSGYQRQKSGFSEVFTKTIPIEDRPEDVFWKTKPPTEYSNEKVSYFETDQDSPVVTPKESALPSEKYINIGNKKFDVLVEKDADGKPFVPMSKIIEWDLGADNATRREFFVKTINPEILSKHSSDYRFGIDFDRLVVAEKLLNSGKFNPSEDSYKALVKVINDEKESLVKKYGQDLFSENYSPKVANVPESVLKTQSTPEFISSGDDMVNQSSKKFLSMAAKYGTPKVDKDIVVFGDKYVGFYDESFSEGASLQKISAMARENKLISAVDKYVEFVNGKYQTMIIYKIIK